MNSTHKELTQSDNAEGEELASESVEAQNTLESEALEPEALESEVQNNAADPQAQITELTDRLHRTMADFDNFRKRTQKERVGMQDEGVRQTIEKLLPVLDNFERAMGASATDDPFTVGIQMILKQFVGTLTDDIGVQEISAQGESFNPEYHFAVSHIDDKQYGDNEVIEVLQKGYKYKDKVVRPSMVRVAN